MTIPELLEISSLPQRITVRAAMEDQAYLRCSLLIYGQQILMIAPEIKIMRPNQPDLTITALSPEHLIILTNTEAIHVKGDRFLTLPKFELRNNPKWS